MNDKTLQKICNDFFKGVDKKKIDQLSKNCQEKKYKKRQIILKPEDHGKTYFVKAGRVEIYQITPDGGKLVVEILGPGPASFFGDLGQKEKLEYYVEAIDNCTVSVLNQSELFSFIFTEPAVSARFFKYYFKRSIGIYKKAISFAIDNALTRLVKLFLSLAVPHVDKKYDLFIKEKLTHEHLSQMLAISRQTATIMLNDLEKKGYIKRQRKKFYFNKNSLQSLIR